MKSFVILVCLAFLLAIDANQPYEQVKPFVFQTVDIPVLSSTGFVEKEYNLKPQHFDCNKNQFKADPDLFEIYQKYCMNSYNHLLKAYTLFCEYTSSSTEPSTDSEPSTYSAERVKRAIRGDLFVNKSSDSERALSLSYINWELEKQDKNASNRLSKLRDLHKKLVLGNLPSVVQLLDLFDFSALSNVTKFAKYNKLKNCQFNETESTFKVNLLEAEMVPTQKVIKPDTFKYLDNESCLVSYAGPELFVYEFSNQTYCALKSSLSEVFELIENSRPLDGCSAFGEPKLLFLRNCTAQYDQQALNQMKRYPFLYIYCYGSQIKFNGDPTIKCPNSAIRISGNNTVLFNDLTMMFNRNRRPNHCSEGTDPYDRPDNYPNCTVQFDNETNEKLVDVFQQIIVNNLTLSG